MDQSELTLLLRKHLDGDLTPEEVMRLKSMILHEPEEVLMAHLQEVWQSYSCSDERDPDSFEQVFSQIHQIIRPARKSVSVFTQLWKLTAIVLLPVLLISTVYLFLKNKTIESTIANQYHIETVEGEKATVTLPDGTKVSLNGASSFAYPAAFGLYERSVQLKGEAFFEVKHNDDIPFIIHTPFVKVAVLGTTFNLSAYSSQSWFEAALVEGSIELVSYDEPENVIRLTPNQKARYDHEKNLWDVSKTDLKVETAWKRGELIFRSQSLASIIKRMEAFYQVKIHIIGQCPDLLMTGSYQEDDIVEVLKNLQYHYHFTYVKSGSTITITFK